MTLDTFCNFSVPHSHCSETGDNSIYLAENERDPACVADVLGAAEPPPCLPLCGIPLLMALGPAGEWGGEGASFFNIYFYLFTYLTMLVLSLKHFLN